MSGTNDGDFCFLRCICILCALHGVECGSGRFRI